MASGALYHPLSWSGANPDLYVAWENQDRCNPRNGIKKSGVQPEKGGHSHLTPKTILEPETVAITCYHMSGVLPLTPEPLSFTESDCEKGP